MTVIQQPISYADVRESIAVARSHGEKFFEQMLWQVENETWTILGYKSWDEMREAEYADMGVVAPRADRPEFVSRLRARGLTQKQIASSLGVSIGSVNGDLKFTNEIEGTPAVITNARGQARPATYERRASSPGSPAEPEVDLSRVDMATGEIHDEPVLTDEPDRVTKLTGPTSVSSPGPTFQQQVAAAVEEFPDLAYYVDAGRSDDVVLMAGDLRRYRERGELEKRLSILRRSIEVDRSKRDGTFRPASTAASASHCPTCTCNEE